jgi:hypothetical protein
MPAPPRASSGHGRLPPRSVRRDRRRRPLDPRSDALVGRVPRAALLRADHRQGSVHALRGVARPPRRHADGHAHRSCGEPRVAAREAGAHLWSDDFFAVERHPQIWFVSDEAALDGPRLSLSGELHAAGRHARVTTEATLVDHGDEIEIAATAHVDQRGLGMTWSPLGMVRTPAELTLRGRLVRADA